MQMIVAGIDGLCLAKEIVTLRTGSLNLNRSEDPIIGIVRRLPVTFGGCWLVLEGFVMTDS